MKIKSGFMLRNIVDNWIVVPIGERVVDFNGLITLNETGAFLWTKLVNESNKENLISSLLEEYDIFEETAIVDVDEFLTSLINNKILDV